MKADDLLVPRMGGRLDSMMAIVPKHSAAFEYQAKGDDMIRIEVEFSLPPGTGEFETNGIRCFKQCRVGTQSDPRKPMQIGMIDFERFKRSDFVENVAKKLNANFSILGPTGNLKSRH